MALKVIEITTSDVKCSNLEKRRKAKPTMETRQRYNLGFSFVGQDVQSV